MKSQLARMILSPGMCWGDEDTKAASPHRFDGTVESKPKPATLIVFPVCVAGERIESYRHDCLRTMRTWVADRLREKYPVDEHAAWVVVTDLAVAEIGRPLEIIEGALITSAVRDCWNAREAERMHSPRRIFG